MIEILERQYRESHKKGGRTPKVTMFDIIRLVEDSLLADERFHLPSKRALLKENIEIAVMDATECEIQRLQKK